VPPSKIYVITSDARISTDSGANSSPGVSRSELRAFRPISFRTGGSRTISADHGGVGTKASDYFVLKLPLGTAVSVRGGRASVKKPGGGPLNAEVNSNEFAYKSERGVPRVVSLVDDAVWRSVITYSLAAEQFKWNIENPLTLAVKVDPQGTLRKLLIDAGVPEKDTDDFLLKTMKIEVAVKVDFSSEDCDRKQKGVDDTLYFDSLHKEESSPWSVRPKSLRSPCGLSIALRPEIRIYIGNDLATEGKDGWYSIRQPVYVAAPDGKAILNFWGALDFLGDKLWEFKKLTSLIVILILAWLLSFVADRPSIKKWLNKHERVKKIVKKLNRGLEDSKDMVDKLD
jgi:hypothetical protein